MSEELEVWVDKNPAVSDAIIEFARRLDALSTVDSEQLDTSVMDIMGRILDADDMDAIFAAANAGTTPTKSFFNTPFRLKSSAGGGITWKRSAATYIEQSGFPWYALCRVTDLSTGEEITLNGGGLSFVTTLYKLDQSGYLAKYDDEGGMPLILEGKPTARGYSVVLIKPFKMPVATGAKTKA